MFNSKSLKRGGFASLKLFLGLAILGSSMQSAHAGQSESMVTLNYRYTLTDLAPLDNIAPSLTLFSNIRYIFAEASFNSPFYEYDENTISPLSKSATLGADLMSASITGSPHAGEETLSIHTLSTTADGDEEFGDNYHEAGAGRIFEGMLSANTAITFHFDYALSATGPSDPYNFAGARLDFKAWHGDTVPRPSDYLIFNYYDQSVDAGGKRNLSGSHTFENRNSIAELVGADTSLRAWSVTPPYADPSPIPEPAAYLLFATGLALLASRKRRRTSRIG